MDKKTLNDDKRQMCKYSPNCYQKNPEHLKKFKHAESNSKTETKPVKNFSIFDFAQKNKKRKIDEVAEEKDKPETSNGDNISSEPKTKRLSKDDANESVNKTTDSSNVPKIKRLSNEDTKECDKTSEESSIPIEEPEKTDKNVETKNHNIPDDKSAFIEEKFLVKMPEDFYKFWSFYNTNTKAKNCMRKMNLALVGPFDVLNEKIPISDDDDKYLLHWRHFYDPPEFQTILFSTVNEFHIGYYRDKPNEVPCFVASNNGTDYKITPMAENLFGALIAHMSSKEGEAKNPFLKSELDNFGKELKEFADKNDFTLATNTPGMKARQRAVVAKTFHGAGIVVPYDKKSQLGYRPLIEKDDKIKKILKIIAEADNDKERASGRSALQPIVTMANIANDECDFGTGLELGLDLFSYGSPTLHGYVENSLTIAYGMLDRDAFGKIITAHLSNRRKGSRLSMADLT